MSSPSRLAFESDSAIREKRKSAPLVRRKLGNASKLFRDAQVIGTELLELFAVDDRAAGAAYICSNRIKLGFESRLGRIHSDVLHGVGDIALFY